MLRRIAVPSRRPLFTSLADGIVALLWSDDPPSPCRAASPVGVSAGGYRHYEQPTYLRLGLRIPELDPVG